MNVAAVQQTVEVQAAQPLLQSEDASLGVVVGTESADNLPLNGRKFNDLAILTPGVTVYHPDNHSSSTDGSAINAYGGQVTWAQVNVDGVTMVNNRHAYVNVYPSDRRHPGVQGPHRQRRSGIRRRRRHGHQYPAQDRRQRLARRCV